MTQTKPSPIAYAKHLAKVAFGSASEFISQEISHHRQPRLKLPIIAAHYEQKETALCGDGFKGHITTKAKLPVMRIDLEKIEAVTMADLLTYEQIKSIDQRPGYSLGETAITSKADIISRMFDKYGYEINGLKHLTRISLAPNPYGERGLHPNALGQRPEHSVFYSHIPVEPLSQYIETELNSPKMYEKFGVEPPENV